MPQATNNDVTIEFETFGDPADSDLLLIMGFTAQMIAWPEELCDQLAATGRHVIRFDNRDCGLSSKTQGDAPNLLAMAATAAAGGDIGAVPYTLSDMANDAIAVLDELDIQVAHVVGASMGGMITQQLAIDHPARVSSVTSIMSTTGSRDVGQSEPAAMAALLGPPPTDRAGVIDATLKTSRIIGGPFIDEDYVRVRAGLAYDRSFYPKGAAFQMGAILKSGDRTAALRNIAHRTLVIHGTADTLIGPTGGEATAAAIPNSKLMMINEMGHALPPSLWPTIVEAISEHTAG